MTGSTAPCAAAIMTGEGDPELVLGISIVAPMLGLSPEAFMSGIQQGTIVQRTERGVDEDAALFRVSFRYRRRRCRIRFNPDTGMVASA